MQESQALFIHWLERCAADRIEKLIGSVIPDLGG